VAASQVAGFVAGLTGPRRGLSVTMPCRRAVVACGCPDEVVTALGVGNTVIFDGSPGTVATTRIANTDVPGIQTVLNGQGFDPAAPVAIWGNGATAHSCVYALARLGVAQVTVRARNEAKTAALADVASGWGITVVPAGPTPAETVISTVPAAVADGWAADAPTPRLVFDVLYDPWPTPLASWATGRGLALATGLDLLAAQAVGQVELMTGRTVPLAVLRQAAAQAMPDTSK